MIVTSRPAFRSASVSSEATVASYESMTTGSSGSESGRHGSRRFSSPPSPATPPQSEQHLVAPMKDQLAQRSIMEIEGEGDNDAATVRSPSMRTYREGDDRGWPSLTALSTSDKPRLEPRLSQSGLVPGPTRVTLRDEGAVQGGSDLSTGIRIKINDQEAVADAGDNQVSESPRNASKFVELLDVDVTPAQVATWLYGSPDARPRPAQLSANDAKKRRTSSSTSKFSRPFLKIATAWAASGSVKSPTSAPSATPPARQRQIILGQQLPGTTMKTSRSKSSNATSNTSPTSSTAGWRRSFLGRPASRIQARPKSMQIVSDARAEVEAARCYDEEEKRWIPAARESIRRFSMSGESDDNNMSDAAPSFASSMESAFAKSGRRRPSSMLQRVSSAQRSFTSAASSVFLPTPAEEREEFTFASGIVPSSANAKAKDVHVRGSSASKDGSSNHRFIKLLRRFSGRRQKENSLRRVTSPEIPLSDQSAHADMARFPASFSSYGSGTEEAGCPPPLSSTIHNSVKDEFPPPTMPAGNPRLYSQSLTDVRNLKSVDEEELPLPATPGEREPDTLRPAIQERSSSLQTVV